MAQTLGPVVLLSLHEAAAARPAAGVLSTGAPKALQERWCSCFRSISVACVSAVPATRLLWATALPCLATQRRHFLTSCISICINDAVPSQQQRLLSDSRRASLQPRSHKSKENKSSPRAQETRQEATDLNCHEGDLGKRLETFPHSDDSFA